MRNLTIAALLRFGYNNVLVMRIYGGVFTNKNKMVFEYNPFNIPMAYLMTFTSYGTWLHGDERGSVDFMHNHFGESFLDEDTQREQEEFKRLKHLPIFLSQAQRDSIAQAINEVCTFRNWKLWELNVRTNHVHVVLSSDEPPKKILRDLKSRSTMNLKQSGPFSKNKLWTRGGSGRYLWNADSLEAACRYVREQ